MLETLVMVALSAALPVRLEFVLVGLIAAELALGGLLWAGRPVQVAA